MSRLIWIYAVCKSLLLSLVAVKEIKGMDAPVNPTSVVTREPFSLNSCLLSCTASTEREVVYFRRRDFAPKYISFPLRIDPVLQKRYKHFLHCSRCIMHLHIYAGVFVFLSLSLVIGLQSERCADLIC